MDSRGRMFGPGGVLLVTQVQLRDGAWVTFDTRLPREAAGLPARLLLTLGSLLAVVLLLSFVAVRWISRPLQTLAHAAEALGKNLHQPPLPETGPVEVQQAAAAFNTMQARLARYIDDRTQVLAAMSHDLKTPLTRLRLRTELLEDDALRQRFESDLSEMEVMVRDALAALRGLDGPAESVPVDMMALLESLQADNADMGRPVEISGSAGAPLAGDPARLRRCLGNLVDNAVAYGQRACITIADEPGQLTIRIADDGPGIPEALLERVFDPFYRVEGSRSRDTGGTGLGLSIARQIARAAGGDVSLRNRPEGGLEATLVLPR
jgi:signal transduction histidine kinase